MIGSFYIKASDLMVKNSSFQGSLELGQDSYEKAVLFLSPKGFNLRFLYKFEGMQEAEVLTVFLGNHFDSKSLYYFCEENEENVEGIFMIEFELDETSKLRDNYYFTKEFYPNNKRSFYCKSLWAKTSNNFRYDLVEKLDYSRVFLFDAEIIAASTCSTWKPSIESEFVINFLSSRIDKTLQINTKKINTNKIEETFEW